MGIWTHELPVGTGAVAPAGALDEDDPVDPVVADLIERGAVPRVNRILRSWTHNGQPLPPGLPPDVQAVIEEARRLPPWVDRAALRDAVDFHEARGLYVGLLYGFGGSMLGCAIPNQARAVYHSEGGADLRDRVIKTARLGHDVAVPTAYGPDGRMVVTAVKTRLVHAAVRHLLRRSPHWSPGDGPPPIPVSQADIMTTWHSLATFTLRQLRRWNLRVSRREAEGFLHLWQVSAHVLGVDDALIPTSWDEAEAQAARLLDPVLAATPEGVALADALLDLAHDDVDGNDRSFLRPTLHAMTRHMLGDETADALEIPRESDWDDLVGWAWPRFVATREGALRLPLPANVFWAFDEIVRTGVLLYLGGRPDIWIEMPTAHPAPV